MLCLMCTIPNCENLHIIHHQLLKDYYQTYIWYKSSSFSSLNLLDLHYLGKVFWIVPNSQKAEFYYLPLRIDFPFSRKLQLTFIQGRCLPVTIELLRVLSKDVAHSVLLSTIEVWDWFVKRGWASRGLRLAQTREINPSYRLKVVPSLM